MRLRANVRIQSYVVQEANERNSLSARLGRKSFYIGELRCLASIENRTQDSLASLGSVKPCRSCARPHSVAGAYNYRGENSSVHAAASTGIVRWMKLPKMPMLPPVLVPEDLERDV